MDAMNNQSLTYALMIGKLLVEGIINYAQFKQRLESLKSNDGASYRIPTSEEWEIVASEALKFHERIQKS